MSTEEQDQIVGRALRERHESRRTLAVLQVKVSDAAKSLTLAADALKRLLDPSSSMAAVSARASALGIPFAADLLALVNEFSDERDRLTAIEQLIVSFE